MSSFSDFALVSLYRTSFSLGGLSLRIPWSGWLRTTSAATFCIQPTQYAVQSTPSHNAQFNISPEWLYLAVASTRGKALYVILFTCSLSYGPTGLRTKSFYGPTGQQILRAYGPTDSTGLRAKRFYGPTGQKIWPVGPNPSSIDNIGILQNYV